MYYYEVQLTFTDSTASAAIQVNFDLVTGDHFIWNSVEYVVIKRIAQGTSVYSWVSGYALQLAPLVPPAPSPTPANSNA
jgi:hypothetical protein